MKVVAEHRRDGHTASVLALGMAAVMLSVAASAQDAHPLRLDTLRIQGRIIGEADCVPFRHGRSRDSFCVSLHLPTAPARRPRRQDDESLADPNSYAGQLAAWLKRYKAYPPRLKKNKHQGLVVLRCTISRGGQVLDATVQHSSGSPSLDRAALDMLDQASPLPPMPESLPQERLTLAIPIEYSLVSR